MVRRYKTTVLQPASRTLIKAIRPWYRVSVDFKGPIRGPHPYRLIAIDEYSRFPFVFPWKRMTSSTVNHCLSSLFCVIGFPVVFTLIEEHHSSATRHAVFSQSGKVLSVLRLLITRKVTVCVNAWIKSCGERSSFHCKVNACTKKVGNLSCWKLCMRFVRLCASRRMKLLSNVCFVSFAKSCSVQH